MRYLGINIGHDASIAIITKDYKVILAISEERLNRKKNYFGFPYESLKHVPKGHYQIAISNSYDNWKNTEKRYLEILFNTNLKKYYDPINERRWGYSFKSKKKTFDLRSIINIFKSYGIIADKIDFFDHHECHAASAIYSTDFNNSLIFTADGAGDNKSSTFYTFENNHLKRIECTYLPNSLGHMYGWATKFLGYKVGRHEGKLTGLAAYGNMEYIKSKKIVLSHYNFSSKSFVNNYHLEKINSNLIRFKNLLFRKPHHVTYEKFKKFILKFNLSKSNIALLAQHNLEESILNWINYYLSKFEIKNIVLAGGVFANVRLNQRISELKNVNNLWVFPEMGDSGLSVGAAYLSISKSTKFLNCQREFIDSMLLGPTYDEKTIINSIKNHNLNFKKLNNAPAYIADLLSQNKVIGVFSGRMEFGPRALGSRSILVSPFDKTINQSLNSRLNRTEFMPFAPCVLSEYAHEIFEINDNALKCLQNMTITCRVKKEWINKIQATVHIDDTARPQLVYKSKQNFYWSILNEFRKLTDVPVLVNTSFNAHEEPIVCSPEDAIRSFKDGIVDYLFFESYEVVR